MLAAQGALHRPRVRGLPRRIHGRRMGLFAMVFEGVLGTERAPAVPADRLDLVVLYVRHCLRDPTPSHPPCHDGPGV